MKELRISMVLNILRTMQELEKTWKKEGQDTLKFLVKEDKIIVEAPNKSLRRGIEALLEYQIGITVEITSNYDFEIHFH